MDEKHIDANQPKPDQVKSAESVRPVALLYFGSLPVYIWESIASTSNNSGSVLSQNEIAKNENMTNLDENMKYDVPEDQRDEIILDLNREIKSLENQVTEHRKWAQEKALSAARRLCDDLSDLKISASQYLEDIETKNAEIKAEMKASKLNASESLTAFLKVSNEEKKWMKKLEAWEKQKTKMQEEISVEKQKISEMQRQILEMEAAKKDSEIKWRDEQKEKLLAAEQVEKERRLREEADASIKARQEALGLKIGTYIQHHKDDLQRLKEELSRLNESAELTHQSANPAEAESLAAESLVEMSYFLHE